MLASFLLSKIAYQLGWIGVPIGMIGSAAIAKLMLFIKQNPYFNLHGNRRMTDFKKDDSSKTIKVAGQEIEIKRVKVKNLSQVTRAFQPFVKEFDRIVTSKKSMPQDELMALIGTFVDEAVILDTVLTDQNSEFYSNLDPLDFFTVMQEVVAFSGDFFMRQIFMPLRKLGAQLQLLGTTASYHSTKLD